MDHLFFNMQGSFDEVAEAVFYVLGAPGIRGDSLNVLDGEYREANMLGVVVRLERNSYDHEESYEYMISVRKCLTSSLKVDPIVPQRLADAIVRMLVDNVGVSVAREAADGRLMLLSAAEDDEAGTP